MEKIFKISVKFIHEHNLIKFSFRSIQDGEDKLISRLDDQFKKYDPGLDTLYTGDSIQDGWLNCYEIAYDNRLISSSEKNDPSEFENGSVYVSPGDADANLKEIEYKWVDAFLSWIKEPFQKFREEVIKELSHKKRITIFVCIQGERNSQKFKQLSRLPWESWADTISESNRVYILRNHFFDTRERSRKNLKNPNNFEYKVLVVLGLPENNFDFSKDYDIIKKSLEPVLKNDKSLYKLEPSVFSENPTAQEIDRQKEEFLNKIRQIILSESRWDMLIFAGHSHESFYQKGVLELSKNMRFSMSDLSDILDEAVNRGLEVAIFNSCLGLDVGLACLEKGVSQAIIMRERIYDYTGSETASENNSATLFFLRKLLTELSDRKEIKDLRQAFWSARKSLKEKNAVYPSAYLLPSMLCLDYLRHSKSDQTGFFAFEPSAVKRWWNKFRPSFVELILLVFISVLNFQTHTQNILFDGRFWLQSLYRYTLTPSKTQNILKYENSQSKNNLTPPVLLISVDYASLQEKNVDASKYNPIDRQYLANHVINKLVDRKVSILGIDYLLSEPTEDDQIFYETLERAADEGTWIILSSYDSSSGNRFAPNKSVADRAWSMQGNAKHVVSPLFKFNLNAQEGICTTFCPFPYLLALTKTFQENEYNTYLSPSSSHKGSLQQEITDFIRRREQKVPVQRFYKISQPRVGNSVIIDLSIPPSEAYSYKPARTIELSDKDDLDNTVDYAHQVVIVASGGYDQAEDIYELPAATEFWRQKLYPNIRNVRQNFTGGEVMAYFVHHILNEHWLILLPPYSVVALTIGSGWLGRIIGIIVYEKSLKNAHFLVRIWLLTYPGLISALYSIIAIHIYFAANIVVPIFSPVSVFWLWFLWWEKLNPLTFRENKKNV